MLLTLEALTVPNHAFFGVRSRLVCRWDGAVQSQHVGTGKLWARPTRNQSSCGICRGKVDEEQRCRNPNQRGE
jgi:hypothetical protein